MKMGAFLIASSVACACLAGCGGPAGIDGKWCVTDASGQHSMTVANGTMTADTGRGGTFTLTGNKVTVKDKDTGVENTLTLSADGKSLTLDGPGGAFMSAFTRCP